ncbi:hypothetical protein [Streptomyces sp. NPDC058326]|uniref:hypothetical protein n=1 Tax=Streptomyces sp. NPDC058326 TaxID=3346447 RepID=UPI0036E6A27D
MSSFDGYSYEVAISSGGVDYWGHTTDPSPDVTCCFARHGAFSAEQELLGTAFHEAGHAVVARLAGIPAVPVEIIAGPTCETCGAVRWAGRNVAVPLDAGSAYDTLTALAAGVQARLLWCEQLGPVAASRRWAVEIGGFGDQVLAREVCAATAGLPGVGWRELDYGPPGLQPQPWNWGHQQQRARQALVSAWAYVEKLACRVAGDTHVSVKDVTAILA